ncbi:MAG: DinB family protein [Chitinophagaceae bacterium]|nr:MAG: DinB family protein [Chitinophagaceae bacterium]
MMTKEISILIGEMNDIYKGDPWYGESMREILEDVNPKIVFDHPLPDAHCIAELLSHIIAWRRLVVRRLQGDDTFSVNQTESFNWKLIDDNPATAWESLMQILDDEHRRLILALEQSDDSLLDKEVAGRKYNFRHLLHHIVHHDIYHLGQITLLKKQG